MDWDARNGAVSQLNDENYEFVKGELLKNGDHFSADLDELVRKYEHVIDSKRRCSYITTFDDLFSVLEKRCHVSRDKPVFLWDMLKRLPENCQENVFARLNCQRSQENNSSNNILNTNQCLPSLVIHTGTNSVSYNKSLTNGESRRLPDHVVERVSEEIGNKWRDLARKLDLRENDLNSFEMKHQHDFKQCAYEALILYQKRYYKDDIRRDFLLALEKARRRDLRDTVQELFNRPY